MKHFCSFSEAIREGAKISVRGTRYMLLDSSSGTCAIGAGAVAIGLPTETCQSEVPWEFLPYDHTHAALREMYPYLWLPSKSPASGSARDGLNVIDVIADLFDAYEWTREQIADWLESEEEKLGFVTLVESESPASRTEMSLSQQPVESRSGVGIENKELAARVT